MENPEIKDENKKKDKIYNVKFIIIGETKVGKTSIINQYTKQIFEEEFFTTMATDKSTKEIEIKGKKLKLEIWDTIGQEKYRAVNKIFMKNTQIALLVYDITDRKSFDDLNEWYENFIKINEKEKAIIGVAANKSDLYEERVVEEKEGKNFAKSKNIEFFETSSKDYDSINIVFETLSEKYLDTLCDVVEKEKESRNTIGINKQDYIDNNNDGNENDNNGKKKKKNYGVKKYFLYLIY